MSGLELVLTRLLERRDRNAGVVPYGHSAPGQLYEVLCNLQCRFDVGQVQADQGISRGTC